MSNVKIVSAAKWKTPYGATVTVETDDGGDIWVTGKHTDGRITDGTIIVPTSPIGRVSISVAGRDATLKVAMAELCNALYRATRVLGRPIGQGDVRSVGKTVRGNLYRPKA